MRTSISGVIMVAQQSSQEPLLFIAAPPDLIREAIAFGEIAGSRGLRVWVGPVSTTTGGALNAASLEALRSSDLLVSLRPYGAEIDRDVDFQVSAARQLDIQTVDAMVHRHGAGKEDVLMNVSGDRWMDMPQAASELANRARAAPIDEGPRAAPVPPVQAVRSLRRWAGPALGLAGVGVAALALLIASGGGSENGREVESASYDETRPAPTAPSVTAPLEDERTPETAARPLQPPLSPDPSEGTRPADPAAEDISVEQADAEARLPEPRETREAAVERPAPPEGRGERAGGVRMAQATEASDAVRGFYSALGRGDGRSATMYVVPGKRDSGPLSGSALTRYYSSLREPLQLVSVRPTGANSVVAEYQYTVGGTRCRGRAWIDVTRDSDGGVLIERIRTAGPC
jgi:hypothetical protein